MFFGEIAEGVFKAAKGVLILLSMCQCNNIFSSHGTALMAFVVLILIDLATNAWLYPTSICLTEEVCQEQVGLYQCHG